MSTFATYDGSSVNVENPILSRQYEASAINSRNHKMRKFVSRIWPLGILTQLTLWYILVFATLMLLFGTVFYTNLRISLATSLDTALQLRTQQIATGISNENGKITIHDVTGELPGLLDNDGVQGTSAPGGQNKTDPKEPHPDVDIGTLVRIVNTSEQAVYMTPAFQALNVPSISITQALQNRPWQGTINARNGQLVRLYSAPLVLDGRVFGVIQ